MAKEEKIIKDRHMNVKLPDADYKELQSIASQVYGGLSLSDLMRMMIYPRLEKVRKSGNPKDFLDKE